MDALYSAAYGKSTRETIGLLNWLLSRIGTAKPASSTISLANRHVSTMTTPISCRNETLLADTLEGLGGDTDDGLGDGAGLRKDDNRLATDARLDGTACDMLDAAGDDTNSDDGPTLLNALMRLLTEGLGAIESDDA